MTPTHVAFFFDSGRRNIPTSCRTFCTSTPTECTWVHIHNGNWYDVDFRGNDRTAWWSLSAFCLSCHLLHAPSFEQQTICYRHQHQPWNSMRAKQDLEGRTIPPETELTQINYYTGIEYFASIQLEILYNILLANSRRHPQSGDAYVYRMQEKNRARARATLRMTNRSPATETM